MSYDYSYNTGSKSVEINTNGKFQKFTLRIPFPENTKNVTVAVNGKETVVKVEQVNNSKYAAIKGSGSINKAIFHFR